MTFDRFHFGAIFVTAYIVAALLALEHLRDESKDNVQLHFGNATVLVVAHPDDETMFFGPTILNILSANKTLLILCLSNGNSDEIGPQREKELANVVDALGANVTSIVIDDTQLQDSMTIEWSISQVVKHVEERIRNYDSPIETFVTFDSYGVSGHRNHQSIYKSIKYLKWQLSDLKIKFLALKSVNLWRKYTSFLDSVFTIATNSPQSKKLHSTTTLSIDFSQYNILKKLLTLHRSQMVWFRQLYMMFSRYMFINELELAL